MNCSAPVILGLVLAALPVFARAAAPAGMRFAHNDWELACDNTRTCRAAGYQGDDDERPVSVLFTREAGPGRKVSGELQIGSYDEPPAGPSASKVVLRIDGRAIGQVAFDPDTRVGALSETQVAALLAALARTTDIAFAAGEHRWHLSDKGAAAVLLKMDEFQGRVGTAGALIRKGPKSEAGVLPPAPVPVVIAAPLAKPRPGDDRMPASKARALYKAVAATVGSDSCPQLQDANPDAVDLGVSRLTETKLLVSTQCWGAAYNAGTGYWVVDDTPPHRAVLVTTDGTDDDGGTIGASHKGRGLGDCWSSETWTWDGQRFVHTEASTTGQCKLVAPGGAWSLPTFIAEVVRPAPR